MPTVPNIDDDNVRADFPIGKDIRGDDEPPRPHRIPLRAGMRKVSKQALSRSYAFAQAAGSRRAADRQILRFDVHPISYAAGE